MAWGSHAAPPYPPSAVLWVHPSSPAFALLPPGLPVRVESRGRAPVFAVSRLAARAPPAGCALEVCAAVAEALGRVEGDGGGALEVDACPAAAHAASLPEAASVTLALVGEARRAKALRRSARMEGLAAVLLDGAIAWRGGTVRVDWFGGVGGPVLMEVVRCSPPGPAVVVPSTLVRFAAAGAKAAAAAGHEATPRPNAAWWAGRVRAVAPGPAVDAAVRAAASGGRALLHGVPGCGKSHLAAAVLDTAPPGMARARVSVPDLFRHGTLGAAAAELRRAFEGAAAAAVVVVEEVDALGAAGDVSGADAAALANAWLERCLVQELAGLLDRAREAGGPAVLATSNRLDAVPRELLRAGRLEDAIELPPPGEASRAAVLRLLLADTPIAGGSGDGDGDGGARERAVKAAAKRTGGWVPADLERLAREAALRAARAGTDAVSRDDLERAAAQLRPSGMQGLAAAPRLRAADAAAPAAADAFAHLGGVDAQVRRLWEAVVWPVENAAALRRLGVRPARGVLLHGPPGCGKTALASALAEAARGRLNVVPVTGTSLVSKVVGGSEQNVRRLFARARGLSPCLLVVDGLDALAPARALPGQERQQSFDRLLSCLLTEMDGVASAGHVVVLATAPSLGALDAAMLRPGRLDHHVELPMPGRDARAAVARAACRGMARAADAEGDTFFARVADATRGKSCADVAARCREAAMRAIRAGADRVEAAHFCLPADSVEALAALAGSQPAAAAATIDFASDASNPF